MRFFVPTGTLPGVLSEGRHRVSLRRISPALIAVPIAVVIVGIGAFLLLRSGGKGIFHGPDNTIPKFSFTLVKTLPIPTNSTEATKLEGPAKQAATEAGKTITELYTEAFLDPANWRDGVYAQVWPLFEGAAATHAQADIGTLTVGTTAGAGYDSIRPGSAKLSFKVLMDDKGMPATIVAIVHFTADAAGKDGTTTALVSSGQYFLHKTADGWRIFSYEVDRADHHKLTPGPSGSPSA